MSRETTGLSWLIALLLGALLVQSGAPWRSSAALHVSDAAHHHPGDGVTIHVENSAESMRHLLAEHLAGQAAVVASNAVAPAIRTGSPPVPRAAPRSDDPDLERWLRPPRSLG